jgi:hypothetical protein
MKVNVSVVSTTVSTKPFSTLAMAKLIQPYTGRKLVEDVLGSVTAGEFSTIIALSIGLHLTGKYTKAQIEFKGAVVPVDVTLANAGITDMSDVLYRYYVNMDL